MTLKKAPRHLSLIFLTTGASVILGCLSFSGMYTIWPVLSLALSAFGLSVAYEGEIYLQNITHAWGKLFKHKALQLELGKEYLRTHFPNLNSKSTPQFFKDYHQQLLLLHHFSHKTLDNASKKQKRRIEKTLADMEKWFSSELLHPSLDEPTPYALELRAWLKLHDQEAWVKKFKERQKNMLSIKIFSAISALFMGLGTTYLLMEAFHAIPLLLALPTAALPFIIIPMAIIAGIAYGFLTYNAITDMMANDTLKRWYHKLRDDLKQGITLKNMFMTFMAGFLSLLAVSLTLCTAGTWWTVAQEAKPLFTWMTKIPAIVMGVINPIVTGLSSLVFNLQNTSESLQLIDHATQNTKGFWARTMAAFQKEFQNIRAHENNLQLINPFRFILKVALTPLRILFFFGHLVSIGLTADRVPGIPQILSTLLGIISEGFEDAHYFVGHDEHHHHHHKLSPQALVDERLGAEHGHHHHTDLPTRFIKFLVSPIYVLAALWDFLTSQDNQGSRRVLTFKEAWNKQMGTLKKESVNLPPSAEKRSLEWQKEHAIFRIERHKEKYLSQCMIGQAMAQEKYSALSRLQKDIKQLNPKDESRINDRLNQAKDETIYSQHRFFNTGTTETKKFLQELPGKVFAS